MPDEDSEILGHVGAQTACNRGAGSDTWLSLLLACQSTSSCLGGMKSWCLSLVTGSVEGKNLIFLGNFETF